VVETLLQSTEGRKIVKEADATKHAHLHCALEYQAAHVVHADSKATAERVLSHLKTTA